MKKLFLLPLILAITFNVVAFQVNSSQTIDSVSLTYKLATITDSAVKADTARVLSVAPSDTKVGPVVLPTWLLTIIGAITAMLPFIQFVLKRIPTAYSIKIGGWFGKLLDILTFFQPDKSSAINPMAPPPVVNGNEQPRLRDLKNH